MLYNIYYNSTINNYFYIPADYTYIFNDGSVLFASNLNLTAVVLRCIYLNNSNNENNS